ncbi:HU family DNA-binding protein [Formicincola oecophyllae]|nr:HU family DNA-binding protein [Formicincola oecophyllae]
MSTAIENILVEAVTAAGGTLTAQQAAEAHRKYAELFAAQLAQHGLLEDRYLGRFHVSAQKAYKMVNHLPHSKDFGKEIEVPASKRCDFDASIDLKEVINGQTAKFGVK